MPIVKNSDLPTFTRLIDEGRPVLPSDRALQQDIRELHIGFLNMMPDAAMEATERQFFRLIGESNRVAQIYIHPFTLPVVNRSKEARAHIDTFYESFEKIQEEGLDALVITGANEETNPHVSDENFWSPLKEALAWAHENVTSTICSCLASHAALTYSYGQEPTWRESKRWGVFRHRVIERQNPIVRGMNTIFDVPHSRHSEITRDQFEKAGMRILVESEQAGVHMATSKDGFRLICFQGHPEYDTSSLFKEYKREINLYIEGKREDYPPFPENYLSPLQEDILSTYQDAILKANISEFPEQEIVSYLENTWADSARSVLASWIGQVYQLTNVDRKKLFMDGVDPENPLGL